MLGMWLVIACFAVWLVVALLMVSAQTAYLRLFAAKTGQDLMLPQEHRNRPWTWFSALPALFRANIDATYTRQTDAELERLRRRYSALRLVFALGFVACVVLAAIFWSSPPT